MHDVAISFLHRDQLLAERVRDALTGQLDVFVYSRAQDEVAATNGLETFREIFRRGSHLVVVLYREPWGVRGWTGVEARAIQDRFLEEGPGFLVFVQLEPEGIMPKWVPESHIRLKFDQYGFDGLLGVIKNRSEQAGSTIRSPTAADRALLVHQKAELAAKREIFRHSQQGADSARTEVVSLFKLIAQLLTDVESKAPKLGIRSGMEENYFVATTSAVSLAVSWHQYYGNSLDNSGLIVKRLLGPVAPPGTQGMYVAKPITVDEERYVAVLGANGPLWRNEEERELSTSALADRCVTLLLELIEQHDAGELDHLRRNRRQRNSDLELF